MSKIVDCLAFVEKIRLDLLKEVDILKTQLKITPNLAIVMVGDNPASKSYITSKTKLADSLGMDFSVKFFDENVSEKELINFIKTCNKDNNIHGILVQLPLPRHLNSEIILQEVHPHKDVDGLHKDNIANFIFHKNKGILYESLYDNSAFIPCTAFGCINLIKDLLCDIQGKEAVIVGRSDLVGYPLFNLLLNNNCTVTIAHSKTTNLAEVCSRADILCVASGISKLIKKEHVKQGATVIDVGISRILNEDTGKYNLCGDVDLEDVLDKVQYVTPVPKGVGPITVMFLMANLIKAALIQINYRKQMNNNRMIFYNKTIL